MLGKLLKYEYKATAIMYLPILVAFLAISTIVRVFSLIDSDFIALEIIFGFLFSVMVLLFIILVFYPIISGTKRFKKNLLSDEGYLMNTLPVTAQSLILSKAIVSITWVFASIISGSAALFILTVGDERAEMIVKGLNYLYNLFVQEFGKRPGLFTLLIATIFVGYVLFLFSLYASMSIGHLASKNRGLVSFAALICLYMAAQLVSTVLFLFMQDAYESFSEIKIFEVTMGISLALNAVYIIVCYFITSRVLTNHLNLE